MARQVGGDAPDLKSLVHGSLAENPWHQASKRVRFPKLQKDIDTDVCIVGASVAGLTAALNLVRAGKAVVLLEARLVGAGNSGRHPGDMTAWKRCQYTTLHQLYDKETVAKVAQSHKAALQHVQQIAKKEDLDCGLKQLDGYVFTYAGQDAETKLQKELSAVKDAQLTEAKLASDVDIGEKSGKLDHAIQIPDTLVIDPVRYADSLADAVVKAGGQIFERSRVRAPSTSTCTTIEGHNVNAREAVVIATGTPITHGLVDSGVRALAVHGKHNIKRRYAIALSLPKGAAKEGVFYELDYPPYIVRITETSGGKLQLIASGEEHDQGIPAEEYDDFYARVETWVKRKWPAAGSRSHQWSYQVFETTEYLSFHGKDPSPVPNRNFYISYGDNGEHLTSATLGGMIISDDILGRPNKFSKLYSPSRKLRGPPGLPPINLKYVENTVKAVAGQVLPKLSNPDIEDMAPDSGAIIQKDVRKMAVYKDATGSTHAYSAVCPHLGCLLQWNPLEKQWNCPCHGSCFDKLGANMGGGPSTIDMAPMDGIV